MNIKRFIDRKRELKILQRSKEASEKKIYTLAIYDPRRIGKTRLLLKFLSERDLYFFANKHKSSTALLKKYESVLKNQRILSELEELEVGRFFQSHF